MIEILASLAIQQILHTNISLPIPEKVRCTCYLPTGNPTYSGVMPCEGMIASNKDHLGDMALLYTLEGDYIGLFEATDLGSNSLLKSGEAIDVYRDDMDGAREWIATYGDYVNVIWVKAEG